MRSHGGGLACYKGHRLPTGSCEPCRKVNAAYQRPTKARYYRTAKGLLSIARHNANRRASGSS